MGDVIIVSSGKGGAGKSCAIINLGMALAGLGKSVAVVDGSLTTPDLSLYLGIPFHVQGLANILKDGTHLEAATFHHKSGLRVIPGNIHTNVLKEFEGNEFRELLAKLKNEHDFVLVDSAAGLGREAVSAIKGCDKMLIITNPELASIVNSSKVIQVAKDLKVEPLGVILNRLGRFRQELKEEDIIPLLHEVPIIGRIFEDKRIPTAAKDSEAVIECYPNCRTSREFRRIAAQLCGEEVKEGFFSRLFGLKS